MKDIGHENQTIFETYQKSILTESKKGFRRKVQILDDSIDDFLDELEKKIDKIDDNPKFQQKMYQELANTTKENSEFLMAMKRVASALDSGAKVIGAGAGHSKPNFGGPPGNVIEPDPMQGQQVPPPGQSGPPGKEQDMNEETTIKGDVQIFDSKLAGKAIVFTSKKFNVAISFKGTWPAEGKSAEYKGKAGGGSVG